MGDFNAQIGNLHIVEPEVVGHHNISHGHNDRGKRLVEFCKQNELFVVSSKFKHHRKYTWSSARDCVRNTVDYILVRNSAMQHVSDVRTLSVPDISDNHL